MRIPYLSGGFFSKSEFTIYIKLESIYIDYLRVRNINTYHIFYLFFISTNNNNYQYLSVYILSYLKWKKWTSHWAQTNRLVSIYLFRDIPLFKNIYCIYRIVYFIYSFLLFSYLFRIWLLIWHFIGLLYTEKMSNFISPFLC